MKAIQIKYIPATTTRGPRLKVFTDAGSFIAPCDHSKTIDQQSADLVNDYIQHNQWDVIVTGFGQLPNGDYVATLGSK